jgi:hypothetical protein
MKLIHCATAIAARLTPVLICAAALIAMGVGVNDTRNATAGTVPIISIDMDIADGACTDIDGSRTQASGSFQAAVCLVDNPGGVALAGFQFDLMYDDTVILAPEVADAAPSLDDNPDANVGTTTFSSPNLGSGWVCDGGVGAHPKGDNNAATGPGNGNAFSGGCGSAAGPNTLITGPLSVISFNITGTGSTALTLANASVTDDNLAEVGSCNPVTDVQATCNNGDFQTSVGAPTNTPQAATNTPTPTNTASAGGASPTHISNESSSTPTPSPTGQATTVPGETPGAGTTPPPGGAASPTTGTGQPGAGVTGPDTGDGPGSASGTSMNLMFLAASGALFVAAGAGVAWRRRRAERDVR